MSDIKVAYFSAEIGIDPRIKTYSGGLGILAGGTIKAMADLNVPLCAVTLLYTKGFFKQKIVDNRQTEEDDPWDFKNLLIDTKAETKVNIFGENVIIHIWKYEYEGVKGHKVPIYYLDTNVDKNPDWVKDMTDRLYQGDRIAQEIILGVGGLRALQALGHNNIEKYHMNEGHSAFLTLELYKQLGEKNGWDDGQVKERCVFTTHTPIPAGHDKFEYKDIEERFKGEKNIIPLHIRKLAGEEHLNMTKLAMNFSSFINAVSRKHKEVTEDMFPNFDINYITNGIHVSFWANEYLKEVYDKYCNGWREDFSVLKTIKNAKIDEIWDAHIKAKKEMISYVNQRNITKTKLKDDVLTIGFARRFVQYKDADLMFKNIKNLRKLGGKVQFVFAGKAHAKDELGKDIMQRIIERAIELSDVVDIAFIEDYDMNVAKQLLGGCDVWLNTPIPFNEASGTSGMKACANGVLHFSRLDGWAIEAFEKNGGGFPLDDYDDMFMTLEDKIIPMFYDEDKTSWVDEMKLSIGNSASYFNTHRMAKEYVEKAYKLKL